MLVYIIGFMGSGKSSLGKILAARLKFNFIDSDSYIEEREGQSISYIFKTKGENYFRMAESKALKDISLLSRTVISTGGGMPCFEDNNKIIKETGISVYLEANAGLLSQRLINEKDKRPLISELKPSETHTFVEQELNQRRLFYEQADICIGINSLNLEQITYLVEQEINALRK